MKNSTNTPILPTEFAMQYDYANSIGWLMRSTLGNLRQLVDKKMDPLGLTNAQWVPLFKLYFEHIDTVAELARGCSQDAGGMTRLLDRLEAKGLCQRKRSEFDRRVVNIMLTNEGKQLAQKIPAILQEVQNAALKDFSEEDKTMFRQYLRRLNSSLKNQE